MDSDDYETLPTSNHSIHMIAGAFAGVLEHCIMYPLDSVKTRMQSLSPSTTYRGIFETLYGMIKSEGIFRPVRGMGAVVAGAGPAHALYFSSYEYLKSTLQSCTNQHISVVAGLSGILATVLHDGVMTPSEVVKQRIQMVNSPYKSIFECAKITYQSEGMRAFYRSYTTQLSMNIPFQSIHFIMYETCQNLTNPQKTYNPSAHMLSGAIAGGFAAAVTTPMDVAKTLLNTQQHQVNGMISAFKTVYRFGGVPGYFRGMRARVLYTMPSTAICWSTYEFFKFLLLNTPRSDMTDREITATLPTILLPEVNLEAEKPRLVEKVVDKFEWGGNVYRPSSAINSISYTSAYTEDNFKNAGRNS